MSKLLIPAFFLSLISVFNLFGIKQNLALNQFLYLLAGFLAFVIVKITGRNFFTGNSRFFYWIFILLLLITFIFGFEARGSKRWIDLYFFNFQASEIFKAFYILFFASFLVRDYRRENPINVFISSFIYFLIPALIIFKQPDLGNAFVYLFVYIMLILFSDLPKKYIFYFVLLALLAFPLGWRVMKDYQRERIVSFFNPNIDRQGTAYNMTQAIITVGSGKFAGRGLGLGTQSRLFFLPENHTDFAYSSLVEQFGFIGGFAVLVLYLTIAFYLIRKLMAYYYLKDPVDKTKFLYLVGFFSYFIFQIFVNLGMNLGLFPVTGIALPFISFGGSSLVTVLIGIALIP